MKSQLTFDDFLIAIRKINDIIQENKIVLSKLDSTIGDGDHGITIAKGLESAMEKIEEKKPANISDLLKTTGNAITITIGGVAGPIFGTFFSEMGRTIEPDKETIDISVLASMFSAALEKIMRLGGANPGDKTMVDALYPAVESIKQSSSENKDMKTVLEDMALAAKKGAESTKDMVSKKGKSSYSGKRSLGFEDAGANTVYFILKAFSEAI